MQFIRTCRMVGASAILIGVGCVSTGNKQVYDSERSVRRSVAQQNSFIRSATPLFQTYEPMNITLSAPLSKLFSVRAKANASNPSEVLDHAVTGTIEYNEASGQKVSVPVTVKLRGNTSQDAAECPFPKMRFRFNRDQIQGTLFEGNDTLSLGTHCGEGAERSAGFGRLWHSNSPEREAFLYRMLEILEIPGYKARTAQVRYVNTENPTQYAQTYTAFFLEDIATIVARHQGVEIRTNRGLGPVRETERVQYNFQHLETLGPLDAEGLIKVGYFQDLIKNIDWSLPINQQAPGFGMLWNMKVFVHGEPRQVVVIPYDFDLAYMVSENSRWESRSGSSVYNYFSDSQRSNVKKFFKEKRAALDQATADLNPTNRALIQTEIDKFFKEFLN